MVKSPRGSKTKGDSSSGKKTQLPYFNIAHIAGDVIALGGIGLYFYTRTNKLQTEVDQVRIDIVNLAKYISKIEEEQVDIVNGGQSKIDQVISQHNNFLRDISVIKNWANSAEPRLKQVEEQQKKVTESVRELILTVNELIESVHRIEKDMYPSKGHTPSRGVPAESPPRRRNTSSRSVPQDESGSEEEVPRSKHKSRKSFSSNGMNVSGGNIKDIAAAARRAAKNSPDEDEDDGNRRSRQNDDDEAEEATTPKSTRRTKSRTPTSTGEDPV